MISHPEKGLRASPGLLVRPNLRAFYVRFVWAKWITRNVLLTTKPRLLHNNKRSDDVRRNLFTFILLFFNFSFLFCCSVLACAHASLSLPQNNKMSINILLLSGRCCGLLSPGSARRNLCCRVGASVMWRNYRRRRSEKFSDSTLILHRSIGQ